MSRHFVGQSNQFVGVIGYARSASSETERGPSANPGSSAAEYNRPRKYARQQTDCSDQRHPHVWLDRIVTGAFIVVTLPVLAGVALLFLCASGRPILINESRIGRRGQSVSVLMFDTTRFDRTSTRPIIKVVHLVRKWNLDELPQLFNVMKGDGHFWLPPPDN